MQTQKVVERMHATIPRCEGLSLKEYGLFARLHKWGDKIYNQFAQRVDKLRCFDYDQAHQTFQLIIHSTIYLAPYIEAMDLLQGGPMTKPQPADKVCISLDCTAESPYISSQCQENHEHNGMISAVRVSRIQEIHNNIHQTQIWIEQTKEFLRSTKQKVVQLIDTYLDTLSQEFSPVVGLAQQLSVLLEGKAKGSFGDLWAKVKQNMEFFGHTQNKLRQQSLNSLNHHLTSIIHKQSQLEQKIGGQSTPESSFVESFSNIFSYLNFELKSKLSESTIQQLRDLRPASRPSQKLAVKLYQICGQLPEALMIYNQMLSQNSLDTEAIGQKALLLKKHKKYSQAYDQLTILLDLIEGKGISNDKFYHFQRAQVCRILGKYEEAQRELQICEKKGGVKGWKLDRQMGHLKLKQGRYQDAIRCYQNALKSEEANVEDINEIHECLFECSQAVNNNALAIQSLTVLHRNRPSQLEYLFKRARLYHLEKQHSKAIQDYSAAIQRVQNIPGLYYNRAVELIYVGQIQSSIPDLKKAIQLDPNFKEAVHLLANTCFDLFLRKDTKPDVTEHLRNLAINTYGYSLNFYPNNHNIWHNLGALEATKDFQKAFECFCKALQINASHIPSYLGKIKTAIKLHRNPFSILKDIDCVIALGDQSFSTLILKASVEQELNLFEQSLVSVESALKKDPSNKEALLLKQRLLQKLSKKSLTSNSEKIEVSGDLEIRVDKKQESA